MTFWYKRSHTQWGDGSVTQDLQEVGPFEVHIGSDMSGVSLQLEPTAFNCIRCIHLCVVPLRMFRYMHSSVAGKPGSATHSSTSTASAGPLCLLVGALVHYIYGRSHE